MLLPFFFRTIQRFKECFLLPTRLKNKIKRISNWKVYLTYNMRLRSSKPGWSLVSLFLAVVYKEAQQSAWKSVIKAEKVIPDPPTLFPLEQLCFIIDIDRRCRRKSFTSMKITALWQKLAQPNMYYWTIKS